MFWIVTISVKICIGKLSLLVSLGSVRLPCVDVLEVLFSTCDTCLSLERAGHPEAEWYPASRLQRSSSGDSGGQ